ncbi:hypothetical protein Ddep01_03314 [Deinococcus depolymerans]
MIACVSDAKGLATERLKNTLSLICPRPSCATPGCASRLRARVTASMVPMVPLALATSRYRSRVVSVSFAPATPSTFSCVPPRSTFSFARMAAVLNCVPCGPQRYTGGSMTCRYTFTVGVTVFTPSPRPDRFTPTGLRVTGVGVVRALR